MSQEEPASSGNITNADVQAMFDQGLRDGAHKLTPLQMARGLAGSMTFYLLVISAFLPLLTTAATGGPAGSIVLTWLAGLGGNALAGWAASWSARECQKLLSGDKAQQQELLEQLAIDLQSRIAGDEALREELATLLDQTEGIATAVASLDSQSDAQSQLIDALRGDVRQTNLIQGRLHQILVRQLIGAEDRINATITSESSFIKNEVQLQAEKVITRLEPLPAMDTKLDTILRMLATEKTPSSNSGVQDAVDARIDIARKLVQDGHFISALSLR